THRALAVEESVTSCAIARAPCAGDLSGVVNVRGIAKGKSGVATQGAEVDQPAAAVQNGSQGLEFSFLAINLDSETGIRGAGDLTGGINRGSVAYQQVEAAEVDHVPVAIQERACGTVGMLCVANDLPGVVDVAGCAAVATEGAEVDEF